MTIYMIKFYYLNTTCSVIERLNHEPRRAHVVAVSQTCSLH